MQEHSDFNKPTTHQGDLTKLPKALAPLVERPQWAVWRWTQPAERPLAEAAVSGAGSAAPCQHQGSQHLERLRHCAGDGAGREG